MGNYQIKRIQRQINECEGALKSEITKQDPQIKRMVENRLAGLRREMETLRERKEGINVC